MRSAEPTAAWAQRAVCYICRRVPTSAGRACLAPSGLGSRLLDSTLSSFDPSPLDPDGGAAAYGGMACHLQVEVR